MQTTLWIRKSISCEAGFHYHSTQSTSANPPSAYYQFADISKTRATVALGSDTFGRIDRAILLEVVVVLRSELVAVFSLEQAADFQSEWGYLNIGLAWKKS